VARRARANHGGPAVAVARHEHRAAARSDWQIVSQGHKFTEGLTANEKGEVFFVEIPGEQIFKIGLDGKVTLFKDKSGRVSGLRIGPDGRLYAAQGGTKRIVAYDLGTGAESVIAEDVPSNDLAIGRNGNIYVTDFPNKQVWLVTPAGEKRVVDTGLLKPNGITLSPDQTLLLVADSASQFVYSFQIQPDGSLTNKQPFYHLHLVEGVTESGADGIAVDRNGTLYVTSRIGLQVADQAGKGQQHRQQAAAGSALQRRLRRTGFRRPLRDHRGQSVQAEGPAEGVVELPGADHAGATALVTGHGPQRPINRWDPRGARKRAPTRSPSIAMGFPLCTLWSHPVRCRLGVFGRRSRVATRVGLNLQRALET
jgi:sugar lactone lactonase YvrE